MDFFLLNKLRKINYDKLYFDAFDNRFQYSWGHRANLEFKKKDCLNHVAAVNIQKSNIFA